MLCIKWKQRMRALTPSTKVPDAAPLTLRLECDEALPDPLQAVSGAGFVDAECRDQPEYRNPPARPASSPLDDVLATAAWLGFDGGLRSVFRHRRQVSGPFKTTAH